MLRRIVRQSELEQLVGCMETLPAGGRLGITNFINRTKAHHRCHQAEALICSNDPLHAPSPN